MMRATKDQWRAWSVVWSMVLLAGCGASIAPMHPRHPEGAVPVTAPVPPDATDVEYFASNALMVPVVGIGPDEVHDTFNEPRDNGGRIHRATDIIAPRGTPIVAAASGKVLRMSQNTLGGITMYVLDDNRRFLYYYAHMDHYSDFVSPGIHVAQGTILGYVGSTGNADPGAPHLHFQAMRWDGNRRDYWNGTPVDVRPFFQLIGRERESGS